MHDLSQAASAHDIGRGGCKGIGSSSVADWRALPAADCVVTPGAVVGMHAHLRVGARRAAAALLLPPGSLAARAQLCRRWGRGSRTAQRCELSSWSQWGPCLGCHGRDRHGGDRASETLGHIGARRSVVRAWKVTATPRSRYACGASKTRRRPEQLKQQRPW